MTTILPPNPPPPTAPDGDRWARAHVVRQLQGNGHANGRRTSRLNPHPTTRLNGHSAPDPAPRTLPPHHKPLFMLRYPAPHYRGTRRRKGGMIRTILAAVGSSFGLLLLLTLAGAGGTAWAAWTWLTYDLPAVDNIQTSTFQSTKIYDRHGGLLWEVDDPLNGRRTYRPIEQIPHNLIDATLAAEDPTFYSNSGVDPMGVIRAVYINLSGRGSSGASTITMQLVRRVLLPEKDELSARRKLREVILASRFTDKYGKDKILETYLNEIYYGSLAYGVDAAAEVYFNKAPADLSLAQSAFLAGLPQSPTYYGDPANFDDAKRRQEIVLGLMLKDGFISDDEYQAALAEDVHPVQHTDKPLQEAPHFVNYVLTLLRQRYGDEMVDRGGLKVFTTIDLDYQHLAEKTAREQVAALQADGASNAALVTINPRTGEILAMVGSVDFTQPDWGQVNVAVAPRQPGSALKPIMYATALKQGYTAASMLPDIPTQFDSGAGQAPYVPTDYDNLFRGPVSMRVALANSLNVPAVAMLKQVGVGAMLDTAQAMGISTLTDPSRYGLSVVLGGGEVTLLELTSAYGTFANGGLHVPPVALLEVRNADGKILEKADPARALALSREQPALTPQQAYVITDILSDNDARTLEFGPNSALRLSHPAAAKTGTTNDYKDSWIIGYSPALVTGVWVGNNDGREMSHVAGARGAGPIWHNFMEGVLADPGMEAALLQPGDNGTVPVDFPKPSGLVQTAVCMPSGLKPSAACPQVRNEIFIAGTEPTAEDNLWKMYKVYIGGKDPMLAGAFCPPESTLDRPFLTLPPEYDAWAAKQQPSLGPPTAIANCATPTPTATATPDVTPTEVPGLDVTPFPTLQSVPLPPEQDSFPGAVVAITAPRPGANVGGEVTITGSADAPAFDHYVLEWAAGAVPGQWTTLGDVQHTPIHSSVLGTWDTTGLPEGAYMLRLTVTGTAGETRVVQVPVVIARTKPTVNLTAPQEGATYAAGDKIVLAADATGPQGVLGVEFYVDGTRVGVAYTAPYVTAWTATPGRHAITAVALSPASSSASTVPILITVGAPATSTAPPSIDFSILAPASNSTISDKTVVVLVATAPDTPVAQVRYFVDGAAAGSSSTSPFQWTWNATAGSHTLLAIGYAADGHELARAQSTVYVSP